MVLSLPWTVPIQCVAGFSVYDESSGLQMDDVWEHKPPIPGVHGLHSLCCLESTKMRMHVTWAFLSSYQIHGAGFWYAHLTESNICVALGFSVFQYLLDLFTEPHNKK